MQAVRVAGSVAGVNWDSVVRSAVIGAVIGAVVGTYYASTVMTKRKQAVIAELTAKGLVATRIAGDWFHVGTSARYRVELEHAGQRVKTAARVDRRGNVTWETALPG